MGYCPVDKVPSLTPTNRRFWMVFALILPGLLRQDGYDYNAINAVFENCQLSPHIRELYQDQCVAVIKVISAKRFDKQEDSCNAAKRRECEAMFGKDNMDWACKKCPENKDKKM
jgi:hypothetical protein